MPKFKSEIEFVRNLFHTIAVANGHDDPDGYADKAAAIHAAKDQEEAPAEPPADPPAATGEAGSSTEGEQASTEGEGNGAT